MAGQPVRREPAPVRLLLQREHDRVPAAVGPFHEQRRVERPVTVAEPLLELLLAHRKDAQVVIRRRRLRGREERQRLAGIVHDEGLEVPVVADGVGHGLRLAAEPASIGQVRPEALRGKAESSAGNPPDRLRCCSRKSGVCGRAVKGNARGENYCRACRARGFGGAVPKGRKMRARLPSNHRASSRKGNAGEDVRVPWIEGVPLDDFGRTATNAASGASRLG